MTISFSYVYLKGLDRKILDVSIPEESSDVSLVMIDVHL